MQAQIGTGAHNVNADNGRSETVEPRSRVPS